MGGPKRPRRHARVREAAAQKYSAITKHQEELTGVLYDSDVIIEILRGRKEITELALALEGRGVPTYCTAITWAEIYAGIRAGEEPVTENFLSVRGEVVLDARTGRQAGAYMARYAKSHGVELADALIAAAAVTSGLKLWTLNRRHYPMEDLEFHEP